METPQDDSLSCAQVLHVFGTYNFHGEANQMQLLDESEELWEPKILLVAWWDTKQLRVNSKVDQLQIDSMQVPYHHHALAGFLASKHLRKVAG